MVWSLGGFSPSGILGNLFSNSNPSPLSGGSAVPIGMGGGLQGSMTAPLGSGVAESGIDSAASPFLQMALQQAMKNGGGQASPNMSPLSAAQDNSQAGVTLGAPLPTVPSVNPQMLARALQRFQG